ncbi:MAG: caspase family protein [Patescibacteria group bacterium]|nr:caspase family protein [Patescibacteria group bacterium]MDD5490960.1 caspase family protein [Patescibacteria group bacterium]
MAIYGNFIGIDKHIDPNIRDLTGARKDATALFSLFSDTIADMQASLLVDENATIEAIQSMLAETLNKAGEEDAVIISFSGHGTHAHQLVTYNTALANLEKSTISVEEIANLFKSSKAKTILFVLDCCFSGGAPAKVLENSPIPRDPGNTFKQFTGEGRILIAASDVNQLAYETPGSGHGLLTKALIDILQDGGTQIDVVSIVSKVMEHVNAEANRLGITQTPVLFGSIKGGFKIPVLKKGKNYFKYFPEAVGTKITKAIKDLKIFGIPQNILNIWESNFKDGLNDLQLLAVNEKRIFENNSLVVVAPTSSGKTFIGELAATKAITEGRKTVFLFPYRALTSEKYEQFEELYGKELGMRIVRCTGDYVDQTKPFVSGKYDIALLTYEMFLNLAIGNPWVLNNIGLIVIDEAQFIADPNRGIVVELLLTYLLTSREKGIQPQVIALSAVIGGINDLDKWLQCDKLVTTNRPVPLIEGVIDRSGTYEFIDKDGNRKTEQLLQPHEIQQRRDQPSAQDVIVPLVKKILLTNENEKIIVFRNMRGNSEGVANYLANDLHLPPALDALSKLPNQDLSSTSEKLRQCLQGGTAFHNTNLSREEKNIVEQFYRNPKSKVRVLGATTTVAAGINTPASTVIIAEQEFLGEDGRNFTVAEYKNMAGRAGRVGFHEEGKSIIYAKTSYDRERLFNSYVVGELEKLTSSFDPNHIETWIIRLLAQINQIPKNEIPRLLANTYGGYLATKANPNWHAEINQRVTDLLGQMIQLQLIEQEGLLVQLTLLGRACGRSALSFPSAMRLVEMLKKEDPKKLNAEGLMILIQALPDLDRIYTPVMKRGTKESSRQQEAVQKYGSDRVRALQNFVPDQFSYYARCKRAAILFDWIHGAPVETIETNYSTTPYQGKIGYGDIIKFADGTRFYLRSAYEISNVMFLGGGLSEEEMEKLLKQLEVGIPTEALDLLEAGLNLERGEYLVLFKEGIISSTELLKITEENAIKIFGPSSLERWKTAKQKVK